MVARRNVTADGRYDLGEREFAPQTQSVRYQIAYAGAPKRCALWRWVPKENRIAFVLDLPSRGDTCFAGLLRGAKDGEIVLYDYTPSSRPKSISARPTAGRSL